MTNSKLTHGLLVESFKQTLVDLVSQNPLDIQSKALVLDYVNSQIQKLSDQQTQREIAEYNEEQKRLEQEDQKQDDEANKE